MNALQRMRKYLSTNVLKTLCNAFTGIQFYYALIIWMCAEKLLTSRLQKINFRSVQVVPNTYDMMNFLQLNDVSSHQRNLHFLIT